MPKKNFLKSPSKSPSPPARRSNDSASTFIVQTQDLEADPEAFLADAGKNKLDEKFDRLVAVFKSSDCSETSNSEPAQKAFQVAMKDAHAQGKTLMKEAIDFYWKFKKRVRTSENVIEVLKEFRQNVTNVVALLGYFVSRNLENNLEVENVLACKASLSNKLLGKVPFAMPARMDLITHKAEAYNFIRFGRFQSYVEFIAVDKAAGDLGDDAQLRSMNLELIEHAFGTIQDQVKPNAVEEGVQHICKFTTTLLASGENSLVAHGKLDELRLIDTALNGVGEPDEIQGAMDDMEAIMNGESCGDGFVVSFRGGKALVENLWKVWPNNVYVLCCPYCADNGWLDPLYFYRFEGKVRDAGLLAARWCYCFGAISVWREGTGSVTW